MFVDKEHWLLTGRGDTQTLIVTNAQSLALITTQDFYQNNKLSLSYFIMKRLVMYVHCMSFYLENIPFLRNGQMMSNFLIANNVIETEQHGSRNGGSTLTQLLSQHDQIVDKLAHSILLRKLKGKGLSGKLLKSIQGFLSERSKEHKEHTI